MQQIAEECGVKIDRTISQTTTETYPPADPLRLRVIYLTNAVTPTDVKTAIDRSVENKACLHIAGLHDIVSSGAAQTTEYNQSDLEEICQYVADVDCDVKIVRETAL